MCNRHTEIDAARAAAGEGAGSTAGNEGIAVCALLAGDLWGEEAPAQVAAVSRHSEDAERIARLEEEMAELRRELSDIKDQMERFRKQFE
jgi:hypothetical protein